MARAGFEPTTFVFGAWAPFIPKFLKSSGILKGLQSAQQGGAGLRGGGNAGCI